MLQAHEGSINRMTVDRICPRNIDNTLAELILQSVCSQKELLLLLLQQIVQYQKQFNSPTTVLVAKGAVLAGTDQPPTT
jgi:hypothetical protein